MTLWITLMDHNLEMDKEILFLYLFSGTLPYRGEMRLKRDLSNSFIYDRFLFPQYSESAIKEIHLGIMLNRTKFGLNLPSSDSIGTKRSSIWCPFDRESVINIHVWFDLRSFKAELNQQFLCLSNLFLHI